MDDRYQVGQLTEELAFGNYFEAEDTLIQRQVQIFRYPTPKSGNEAEWKETFGASSADLATASHPGLPIIYTHGIDEDGPYSIRQLLDTVTLNAQLADNGPLSEYESWELAQQMLEIHDAARPSNNFHGALDANHIGQITRPSGRKLYSITDYGLAEIYKRMNNDDAYLGAPYLISPEQGRGEAATESSQIYAIGQLVYHALCGGHPWIETPLEEIVGLQKSENQRLVTDYNPNVPEAMAQWVATMVALDPNDRYKSFEEAVQNLPEPIQSAPVPIQATGTVYTMPATQTTATQTVAAEQPHITNAAEDFAAQQAALGAAKKQSNSEKVELLKNPMVLGGAGVLLILLICVIFMSGDDEDSADNGYQAAPTTSSDLRNLPREGLIAYIDFNDEKVEASNNPQIKLEALKSDPSFSRNGRSGKGLTLDKNHYFRLPLRGTPLSDKHTDFTVSFWVKPHKSSDQDLVAVSKEPWMDGETEVFNGSDSSHLWKPDYATVAGSTWNMITMVCSKSSETLTIYIDGKSIETSGNAEVNNLNKNPFIYIGCDSNERFLHNSPATLDNMAIWDRALGAFEIKELYNQ